MTDTADRTEIAEISALPGLESGDAPAARRRSGSLSSMLLPELQQLAGSMGIPTAKKKKSDLVAAITAHRAGGSSAPRAEAPVASAPAPVAAPAESAAPAAPVSEGSAPRTRTRRAASRPVAAPEAAAAEVTTAPTPEATTSVTPAESAAPPRTERAPRQNRENRDGNRENRDGNRENRDGQQSGRQGGDPSHNAGQSGNQQPRGDRNERPDTRPDRNERNDRGDNRGDRNDRSDNRNDRGDNRNDRGDRGDNRNDRGDRGDNRNDRGDRNNDRGGQQNRQDRQSGGTQQGGYQNDRDDDFDDDGTGRRRGRRYRDRNRNRNRDRVGGPVSANEGNEREPSVGEDEVLVPIAGIVDEIADKNTWFVRVSGYFASTDDIYVQNSFVRRYNLRRGDAVTGAIRPPREGERREKYSPLMRLDTVNGAAPSESGKRPEFTKLTPLYPQERLRLETESHIITTRVIDLVMPIGKGQRALIVSPPKAGKTMVLQAIANAITTNNPECHLMVVLVDERPEEVTDMQRSVKGEVIASTFDRRPQEHTMVAELSIERAKRLVEMGHDVVVLLDSITRLGRAYNLAAPTSGRILSGGVDSSALYPPKRFLGAARNIENGGSLTIIATALVETGSAGDTVIFEEYKGTGNAELKLDRKIADKRVFPAVDVDQSSTRKEELLLATDEFAVVMKLRRVLHALDPQQAIDLLTDRLKKTRNNYEFLMQIAKTTPGGD